MYAHTRMQRDKDRYRETEIHTDRQKKIGIKRGAGSGKMERSKTVQT